MHSASIILEKSLGNLRVEKMRVILLLEADWNGSHKININGRLMPHLEAASSMPHESIGGRRSQAATHLALSKKLIADIFNIRKIPTATMCANATNSYDRAAHPHASLCSQCFSLDIYCLLILFRATQNVKIHSRTAFRVSSSFCASEGHLFQGSAQGDRAAPALWLIILIFLIRHLYYLKAVLRFSSPISNISQLLAALAHAGGTDLHVLNNGSSDVYAVVLKAEQLLDTWRAALRFTGGDLKLSKYYWALQDYQ